MAETYDGNGDYAPYNGEPRKSGGVGSGAGLNTHNGDGVHNEHHHHHHGSDGVVGAVQLNDKANEYVRDCLTEKSRMDRKFPIAEKLLDCEIEKVQSTGRIPSREQKYADIYREKPLRVSQRVLVPIREHPKFNFVGKLLGPKGNSLRRLQEETLCKMTVLGRNSMRDRVKEEELRASKDPKYAHLNTDLHVEISTIAPPAEAYARIAYAMAELRKYLIPDSNDVIRQEQLRELMDNTSLNDNDNKNSFKKMSHMQNNSNSGGGGGGGGMGMSVSGGPGGSSANTTGKNHTYRQQQQQQQQQQQSFSKNVLAPKQKVMSILEKARTAMDETYGRGYDDSLGYEQQPSYDAYSYAPQQGTGMGSSATNAISGSTSAGGSGAGVGTRGPYETQDYETDYSRRDYYQHSPSYGSGSAAVVGATTSSNQNSAALNSNHNRSHVNR